MGTILWLLILFFVLRFVYRYVLPVASMISNVNRKLRTQPPGRSADQSGARPASAPRSKRPKKGEYIDFEELK